MENIYSYSALSRYIARSVYPSVCLSVLIQLLIYNLQSISLNKAHINEILSKSDHYIISDVIELYGKILCF